MKYAEEIVGFLLGGLCGGAIVSLCMTGEVLGAKWWEAMAAFGTVGAVFFSVMLSARAIKESTRNSNRTADAITRRISPEIARLQDDLEDLIRCFGEISHLRLEENISEISLLVLDRARQSLSLAACDQRCDQLGLVAPDMAERLGKIMSLAIFTQSNLNKFTHLTLIQKKHIKLLSVYSLRDICELGRLTEEFLGNGFRFSFVWQNYRKFVEDLGFSENEMSVIFDDTPEKSRQASA